MQDALGLKKMTAFMADNDLESGTDGKSNSRDKRIPKPNAVEVFGACADHEFPAGLVSGAEMFETLAHTPRARRWLPIELFLGEFRHELRGGLVVGVQVRSKADGPNGRTPFLWYGHNADHSEDAACPARARSALG
jgi:hypothetical protein